MTVVVFAYHDVGCRGIRTLRRLGVPIGLVHTPADDPRENRWFGSVRRVCEELSIPCVVGADPHEPAEVERIRALRPPALLSFYWRDLLRDDVLALAPVALNLHGSLLPRYRGRAPVNWMLLHGETQGGVTLHHMVRRADAGDIVDQEPFPIGDDDTPTEVYAKLLAAAETVLLRSALPAIAGTAPRIRQMESKATTFGRRTPDDGRIDWRWSAEDVRNLVRAVTEPYPGAFTSAGAQKVLVWEALSARPDGARRALAPGTVCHDEGRVHVVCGDRRTVRLVRVEADGRRGDPREFPRVLPEGAVLGAGGA